MSKFHKEKGISLYLVILLSTLVLAIGLGISSLLVARMKVAREIGHSVVAFYAADTGIEHFLDNPDLCSTGTFWFGYLDLDGGGTGISDCQPPEGTGDSCTSTLPSYPGDACYAVKKFTGGPCPATAAYCIESIGYYKKARRAIEVSR